MIQAADEAQRNRVGISADAGNFQRKNESSVTSEWDGRQRGTKVNVGSDDIEGKLLGREADFCKKGNDTSKYQVGATVGY